MAVVAALLAALLLWIARRVAPGGHPALRLGMAALARRRGLSIVQATALSLGLTALLLLAIVAPSLLDGWRQELPSDTPNWFVLNLQDDQRADFSQALSRIGGNQLNMMPLAVGKLTAINGQPIDQMNFKDERAKDSADRQLRLSWADELPPSNTVIAGQWFAPNPAQAEVSADTMWRDMYRSENRRHDALRSGRGPARCTRDQLSPGGLEFVPRQFLPDAGPGACQRVAAHMAGEFLSAARQYRSACLSCRATYPNLSLVDVDALLDRVREIVQRVTGAVRWVLGFQPAGWCTGAGCGIGNQRTGTSP